MLVNDENHMKSSNCSRGIIVCDNCNLSFNEHDHLSSCQLRRSEALNNIAAGSASISIDGSPIDNLFENNYPSEASNLNCIDFDALNFLMFLSLLIQVNP